MHNKYKKYCTIREYATHSGSYSTERSTLYTGTHVVHKNHNIHSGAQHIHDTETIGLLEGHVASTIISVLILSST